MSCGFGLVWHMWWLAGLGLTGAAAAIIARSFVRRTDRIISPGEIEAIERRWLTAVHEHRPISRELERTRANHGVAEAMPT